MKHLPNPGAARALATALALLCWGAVHAATTLHVYGPGGPAPAMKEAAAAFEAKHGVEVELGFGPTPKWIDAAKADADLIYSGSETMMTDFVEAMQAQLAHADALPLYLRPMAILVRPGNPKRIRGVKDLLRPGVGVLVVNGAGQTGAWEDVAGRKGDIRTVKALRANIRHYAKNSGQAKEAWSDDASLDAWLIWNIWQVENPKLAELVPIEADYAIYRDTGIAPTLRGKEKPEVRKFIEFLQSPAGAAIFARHGWIAGPAARAVEK